MFKDERIRLVIDFVFIQTRVLLHGGDGGRVDFQRGVGTFLARDFLHLKDVGETARKHLHHACPPEEDGLPLMVGEFEEKGGVGRCLPHIEMEIFNGQMGVRVKERDAAIEDGGEKHGASHVHVVGLLR